MISEILDRFGLRWGIAGGWALDLFLGRETRPHHDVDVAVLRRDLTALRGALPRWTWTRAVRGRPGERRDLAAGELVEPPDHEVYATSPDGATRLEILLNDAAGDVWVYRRDPRVTLALRQTFLRSAGGVPYLAPEIVLLFKSKRPRPIDRADRDLVLPHLGARRRAWLDEALRVVGSPAD